MGSPPSWFTRELEESILADFPGLSPLDLRNAARQLDAGMTPVDLIVSEVAARLGIGADLACQVLIRLRTVRNERFARGGYGRGPQLGIGSGL